MMRKFVLLLLAVFCCQQSTVLAQNPVVQTWFTSDPAPMAYGDKLYVYTGHDEDKADFFWMYEWRCYSSSDMVNWTDHGPLLSLNSFSWADDRAWAAQTIERDGKFYWYICAHSRLTNGMAIGVAVADSPTGPFRDALGKPLFDNGSWDNIDPTVMIDDDGQAWLFWGNPTINYARLNRDMLSFDGEVRQVNQTVEGFGAPNVKERQKDVKYKDCYTEGPWIMKKDKLYYLLYAAGGIPEHIAYSSAPSPEGPWTYRGEIMPQEDTKSFTNHCGVADFKGHSYFFYHTGKLPGGGGFGRSAAVEEFKYNADGSFPIIHHTDEGVAPIGTLSPWQRTEAETIAWSVGVKTENSEKAGVFVSDIHNGDYIKVREVDFGSTQPIAFVASTASALQGGRIEVRLDSLKGQLVAVAEVPYTGAWENWKQVRAEVTEEVSGTHDVYFAFKGNKGSKLFNFDWWKFEAEERMMTNPMIFADVPDLDIIRVDDTYYMVSTTMHFAPGCGIMKSKDLVNWEICNYAYDELDEGDNFRLLNSKSEYSQGSWAANLRYDPYEKMYYMIMTCNTTGKTYFYVTDDIEHGKWHCSTTDKCYDPGLLFEDTGKEMKKYVLHPADTFEDHAMYLREISVDKDWNVSVGEKHKVIDYANLENPARGLRAEGYHGYKIGDYYYIFMIQGCDGQRQEIVWRSKDLLNGKWESRMVFGGEMVSDDGTVVMKTNGIGQGGIVGTRDGQWWCFLFKDYGSVGRMPVWLPMKWSADGWPVVGTGETTDQLPQGQNMTTPYRIDKPLYLADAKTGIAAGVVENDEFNVWKPVKSKSRFGSWKPGLKLCWQWNHIPDAKGWSLTQRKGWLRLTTTSVVKNVREARNTLTQRTFGPTCQGEVLLDASKLKDGDYAGLSAFQNRYGFVGVKKENGQFYVVMHRAMKKDDGDGKEMESLPLPLKGEGRIWLRVNCDFRNRNDKATFSYSLDGQTWTPIGDTLKMYYDWPDFCGYRFALFHFATQQLGGIADFDYFHIEY